jgi:hypothetical protein
MPRPKGLPKTGGKVKGTQHKANSDYKQRILNRNPLFHPIEAMYDIWEDKALDPALRFNALKEMAKYFEPQLKAIELSTPSGLKFHVKVSK